MECQSVYHFLQSKVSKIKLHLDLSLINMTLREIWYKRLLPVEDET